MFQPSPGGAPAAAPPTAPPPPPSAPTSNSALPRMPIPETLDRVKEEFAFLQAQNQK